MIEFTEAVFQTIILYHYFKLASEIFFSYYSGKQSIYLNIGNRKEMLLTFLLSHLLVIPSNTTPVKQTKAKTQIKRTDKDQTKKTDPVEIRNKPMAK